MPRLLRDRAEDIPELIEYFIKEAAAEVGSKVTGITDAAQTILSNFDWPGSNREKAAKILGIGERTLYRKIKEYNL